MRFWDAQRKARKWTFLYLTVFFLLAFAVAFLITYVVQYLAQVGYIPPMPYLGIVFLGITFLVSGFYYLSYRSFGGNFVAESLGGRRVEPTTSNLKEQQLLNVVQEMAIASSMPMPPVYIVEAREINAFAAGIHPKNAAVTVTRGALEQLNREELQGVVAHEFGHIASGDMRINMRLAAMLMGFFIVSYLGIRLLEGSVLVRGGNSRKGGNPVALIALVLLVAGLVTWFAGAILRATISREREYLADASSVQFTRNPKGIANALRKIGSFNAQVHDMPKSSMGYSHLFFDNRSFWSRLFATHPPIEKRIAAIEGRDVA